MEPSKNEIKKALYREKPIAGRCGSNNENHEYNYSCYIKSLDYRPVFIVPIADMGNVELFKDKMPAQELIRWLTDGYKIGKEIAPKLR